MSCAEGGGSRASSGSEAGSSCSGSERSERDESSLELESESASASGEASRRTDSGSGEAARSEVSRSDADDNGNLPGFVPATTDGQSTVLYTFMINHSHLENLFKSE